MFQHLDVTHSNVKLSFDDTIHEKCDKVIVDDSESLVKSQWRFYVSSNSSQSSRTWGHLRVVRVFEYSRE